MPGDYSQARVTRGNLYLQDRQVIRVQNQKQMAYNKTIRSYGNWKLL